MTTDVASNAQEEERKDATDKEISHFWQVELGLAEREQQDWIKDAAAVVSRYKNESASVSKRQDRRFNILFSNTETLKAALYGKTAKPDVRRRFADKDQVARQAAEVVERGLIYCAEVYDVDKCIERGIHDYLLPGRGVIWVEYEPVFKSAPATDPTTGQPVIGDDGEPVEQEFIAEQKLRESNVYWEDYLQSPARSWDGVWWVARRHLMSRQDLRDNKFKNVSKIPLNWEPKLDKKEVPDSLKKAEVWEIWDKPKRERVWIVKGHFAPLRVDDDPYGLESFFPLPEPIISIGDTQTNVPTPEFKIYQAQADDLDEITSRISHLTRAMKRRGVYNKALKELKRLAKANDNEFIEVDDWSNFASKGGLEGAFQTEDLTGFAVVLKELYVQRDMLVQGIYELTGIADIMRGATDPNETLGAQQLKAQFGSNRLKRRQRAVQKWIRDLYKLKAEIIAEHFEPQILQEMTGIQLLPAQDQPGASPEQIQQAQKQAEQGKQVIQLLRSDKLRSYRIDIETDSTVFEDAEAVKQQTVEVLTAVGGFLQQAVPAAQTAPEMAPLLFEMLSVGVRHFKRGRELEDIIEQTKDAIMQKSQGPQQPNPDDQALQAKAQMEQQKLQHQAQLEQAKMAQEQAKMQQEAQLKEREFALQVEQHKVEIQFKQEEHRMKLEAEAAKLQIEQQRMAMDQESQQASLGLEREKVGADVSLKQADLQHRSEEATAGREFERDKIGMPARAQWEKITENAENVLSILTEVQGEAKQIRATVEDVVADLNAPTEIVRGPDGRAASVRKGKRTMSIKRDKSGRAVGTA